MTVHQPAVMEQTVREAAPLEKVAGNLKFVALIQAQQISLHRSFCASGAKGAEDLDLRQFSICSYVLCYRLLVNFVSFNEN